MHAPAGRTAAAAAAMATITARHGVAAGRRAASVAAGVASAVRGSSRSFLTQRSSSSSSSFVVAPSPSRSSRVSARFLSSARVAMSAPSATVGVEGVLPGVTVVSAASPVVLIQYQDLVDKKDLSASVKAAFGATGLGIIVVSGVPEFVKLRANLLPLARTFASLPEEVKLKYEHPASHYNFGWSHGKETLAGKPDFAKGSYYANPLYDQPFTDADLLAKFPSFCAPNLWPTEDCPQLADAFKSLGKVVCETGFLLAQHCDRFVQSVNPTYETDKLFGIISKSRTAKARLLHYFPATVEQVAGADVDGSWCGWHNDHGSLTGLCSAMYFDQHGNEVLNPDPNSGLYIRTRSGETVKAIIPADCLAFQIGETAQIHSCGALQATPHCVMAGAVPNISRETFAVFMEPEMFEPMSVPPQTDTKNLTGGTTAYLPKGVPPLSVRWKNEYDFGTFTNATLAAYHPDEPAAAEAK